MRTIVVIIIFTISQKVSNVNSKRKKHPIIVIALIPLLSDIISLVFYSEKSVTLEACLLTGFKLYDM